MVVGPFPVAKLGFLLLRTLSKPIANTCKERAKQSPFFRKYICLPPAHFYNWCEVKTKMWILNLGQPVQVPPLNEAMAIDLGANLLGEGILFVVAALVVVVEYRRQAAKQAAKDQEEAEEKEGLHLTIRDLSLQLDVQQAQLRELFRHVYDLESRVVKLPFSLGSKPKDGEGSFSKKSDTSSDVITEAISYLFKNILDSQAIPEIGLKKYTEDLVKNEIIIYLIASVQTNCKLRSIQDLPSQCLQL